MAPLATYDPGVVTQALGPNIIGGYAEDSQITVELNSPLYTMKVGAGGEVVRSRSRDKSGTITFKLLQTSPSNDVLSALAQLDQTGLGVVPYMLKDMLSPTTIAHAATAWISEMPKGEYGKESGDREWKVQTNNLELFFGGNPA